MTPADRVRALPSMQADVLEETLDAVMAMDAALLRAEIELGGMAPSSLQRGMKLLLAMVWSARAGLGSRPPPAHQVVSLCQIVEDVLAGLDDAPTERFVRTW